jgi:hypothetical protein
MTNMVLDDIMLQEPDFFQKIRNMVDVDFQNARAQGNDFSGALPRTDPLHDYFLFLATTKAEYENTSGTARAASAVGRTEWPPPKEHTNLSKKIADKRVKITGPRYMTAEELQRIERHVGLREPTEYGLMQQAELIPLQHVVAFIELYRDIKLKQWDQDQVDDFVNADKHSLKKLLYSLRNVPIIGMVATYLTGGK